MIESLADELTEVDLDGVAAWVLTADLPSIQVAELPRMARLLPGFDPWTVGASRRGDTLPDPSLKIAVYRPQGWISPVLLVDGRMVGTWKNVKKSSSFDITVTPFSTIPRWAKTQVGEEAERLSDFLGLPLNAVTFES
jgi:hypothetical protein